MEPFVRRILSVSLYLFALSALSAQNNTRPSVFLPDPTGMKVNSYNGSLSYQRQDVFIPGRGLDIDVTFFYNSTADSSDWGYGYGWTHTYNMHYTEKADSLTLIKSDGRRDIFVKSSSNYTPPVGVFDKLEAYEPGKLRLTAKSGMRYFFDDPANRKLTRIEDRNGNAITLNWSGNQLLALTDAAGRQITFSWSGGHLAGITDALDSPTRSWTYAYDAYHNLVSATNPLGGHVLYACDNVHRLARTTDENNRETAVEYYENSNAVKSVATCLTRHTFTYNLDQGKSFVKEIVGDGAQTTTYEFDAQGRNIARKGNCCGFETSFQYDASNNITKTTDGNGNSTTYTFDANGNATAVTDPEGCTVQMTYEPAFNQSTSFRDKNGNLTAFSYDNKGNLTGITRPLGVSETYTYDAFGNQTSYTDARGNTTTYEYNANGYLTKINHPVSGLTTQFTYDNRGNRRSQTDGNGHVTQYQYDALNRLTDMEDALGHKTTHAYDARGNRTQTANALGYATTYTYDQLERLVETKAPLDVITKYAYDSRGNRLSDTDQRGSISTYTYDSRNFLVAQKDPLGYETTYVYDGVGNQVAVTDPNGHTTQYFYDKLNRLVKTKDPLGYETNYAFDCNGNTLSVTDANGHTVSYAYDALNRQISMTDALSYTTHFEYDKNNNLTKITDAKGNPTRYDYDAMNRKTVETYADNTTKVFTYDGAGNVASRKDNAGNMTYYTYDALNRLTLRDYPDANDDHFAYDALSRMTEATNQNAVVTFSYDALNRMLGETLNGKTTGYAYNNATGRRTLIYPSGRVIQEYYDQRNQLESIRESNETLASFAYDPAGRMTTRSYGNGTITTYTYDADNRVTSILANPDSFIYFRYAYDNVGNKLYEEKRHHPTHSEAYGYDANYRLTSFKVGTLVGNDVPAPSTQTVYNYDALGNRTTVVKDGEVTTYGVNEMNEYVMVDSQVPAYDPNGNLNNNFGFQYLYDYENRIIESSSVHGDIFYSYDPKGRRIKKTQNSHEENYFFSKNMIIEKHDFNDRLTTFLLTNKIDEAISLSYENQTFYFHNNDILSTTAISDMNSHIIERYEYDRLGNVNYYSGSLENISSSIFENNILFTGREWDAESKSFYFRKRSYDPTFGVFYQRDPRGFVDGLNLYNAYFITIGVDPFGSDALSLSQTCLQHSQYILKRYGYKFKCNKDINVRCETCCGGIINSISGSPLGTQSGNEVTICISAHKEDANEMRSTIEHELQHQYDECNNDCERKDISGFTDLCACKSCTEIKAYSIDCGKNYGMRGQDFESCVKNGAKSSVGFVCKWAVNIMYEECIAEDTFLGNFNR